MGKERKYIKPELKEKKVKISFFLSNNRFSDSMDGLSGSLLAQQGSECGTCPDGGGPCADGCGTAMCA